MIFLQDNVLLKRDLKHEDIKPRLLGKQLMLCGGSRRKLICAKAIGEHVPG